MILQARGTTVNTSTITTNTTTTKRSLSSRSVHIAGIWIHIGGTTTTRIPKIYARNITFLTNTTFAWHIPIRTRTTHSTWAASAAATTANINTIGC